MSYYARPSWYIGVARVLTYALTARTAVPDRARMATRETREHSGRLRTLPDSFRHPRREQRRHRRVPVRARRRIDRKTLLFAAQLYPNMRLETLDAGHWGPSSACPRVYLH
jgi:hypothetical protein